MNRFVAYQLQARNLIGLFFGDNFTSSVTDDIHVFEKEIDALVSRRCDSGEMQTGTTNLDCLKYNCNGRLIYTNVNQKKIMKTNFQYLILKHSKRIISKGEIDTKIGLLQEMQK